MDIVAREKQWLGLSELANRRRVRLMASLYRDHGLFPLVLKGWAVARFYDPGVTRAYTDVDLAFEPGTKERAVEIWLGSYLSGVSPDIHDGLRRLELLSWNEIFDHTYVVNLDGVPVRVLADEDNLRVTAVHWLTDGGVNKERLWDIFYLVKNRKEDFNWERCLESNGPIRKTWVMAAIATARDRLDLDVSGLPEEAQRFQLPVWFKKTLEKEWKRGVYPRRILSTVITRPKLLAEQLYRRFPPNKIAATIDTETPIDNSSRLPAQIKSLTNKVMPFARGLGRRLTYSRHRGET